jgi:uncharacterized protein YgiM (DUF1202 family)
MFSRALVPLLALTVGFCGLGNTIAAADNNSPSALNAPPGTAPAITATVQVPRANVRFGPAQTAKLACTLNRGDTVSIIGAAQVPDWYVVAFPTQGRAWVSAKVLAPVDGGKRWKVIVDGAHARADATVGAEIVCDMAVGEVLEDRGAVAGDFHAVYIPSAVAYVKKELLALPSADAVTQQVQNATAIDQLWQKASAEYIADYQQVQADPKAAQTIAWDPLLKDLDKVASESPDALTAQKARRCHDGILRMIEAAKSAPAQATTTNPNPTGPVASNGGAGKPVDPAQTPPAKPDNPGDYVVPAGQPGAAATLLQVPESAPPSPEELKPAAPAATAAPAGPHAGEGYVIANSDYAKISAPYLLQDGNSNVIAFLTVKDGANVNLAEYAWRSVGVDGDKSAIDAAALDASKLPAGLPLITVERVSMLGK